MTAAVLLVTDDDVLAGLLLPALERAGVAAAHLPGGRLPAALGARPPADLRAVIVDREITGVSALGIVRRLRGSRVRVVLLADDAASAAEGADCVVLSRPFDLVTLVRRVASLAA